MYTREHLFQLPILTLIFSLEITVNLSQCLSFQMIHMINTISFRTRCLSLDVLLHESLVEVEKEVHVEAMLLN